MRIIVGFQALEEGDPLTTSTKRLRVAQLYTEEEEEEGEGALEGALEEGAGRRLVRRHHVVFQEEDEDEDPLKPDPVDPSQRTEDKMGECSLSIIDHGLTRLFYWLGNAIGKHPSYYVIIPIFVSLLFGTGLQRLR